MNCLTCLGTFGTPQHWYASRHLSEPLYLCETCAERWRIHYRYEDLHLQDSPERGGVPPLTAPSWPAPESANS